jgi:hypothetical protein
MSMSSLTRLGLAIAKLAARLASPKDFGPTKRPRRCETSGSIIIVGSPMLALPSARYGGPSVLLPAAQKESGIASTPTTPPASLTKPTSAFDVEDWSENLKATYGIALAQDFDDDN